MPKAFVLMNAELGSEDSIVNELKKLEGVKEVYQVYGVYDIVAQVEANTMERVKETITWKLRKLNGVKSTLACKNLSDFWFGMILRHPDFELHIF